MKVLSFLADLCTVVTAMVAVVLFIYRFFKQENKNNFNRGLSFFLFVSIVVLFIGSLSLLLLMIDNDNTNKKYFWIGIFSLPLSVLLFVFYAYKAYVSLDKNSIDNILPPGMFWQMFFNKIPARIVNVDSKSISFAVVKMDDCDEVNEAAKTIQQSYENKQKYCIKVTRWRN